MTRLKERLGHKILKKIEEIDIKDIKALISSSNSPLIDYKHLINFAYDEGIIDDVSIEKALEVAVNNKARRYYQLVKKGNYLGYTLRDMIGENGINHNASSLSYALHHGKFSPEEVANISLDKGDTVDNVVEIHIFVFIKSFRPPKTFLNSK
tara:strand:- start:989 stop:1444 length:456 start_codon:yes stop_codon:yes gene_type:complete